MFNFTHVLPRLPACVYLSLSMFYPVYSCFSKVIHILRRLPMFTQVYSMFYPVYSCLPQFIYDLLRLPMFTPVCPCFSPFTRVQTRLVYRWFSLDVIAAMLVYRTIEKKSFGNLTLLLCKIRAIICYCFVHQHGRLITWLQTIYTKTVDSVFRALWLAIHLQFLRASDAKLA